MAKNFVSNLIIRTKDETTAVVNRVGGAFKSMGGIVAGVAATLATAFSVRSIGRFLTGATQEAGEFQRQIAIVGNVAGATAEDLAKLRATAEQLGSSTAFSASQAAQGMEALARAGLNAEQTISTIPAVLALAQGQSLELGQSASFITQAMAGLGLEISEAGRVADVLAKGAQSANTNVEGLASALSFAAPAAQALGVDLEDTVALIGKLSDAGIDASRAGTALSNVFLQFKDPASSFRKELAEIGITTDDFGEALNQLEAAGEDAEGALLSLGQRGGPALRVLVSQGGAAIKELSDDLRNAGGAAQDAADAMNNTLPGALAGLRSAWESLRLSLGDALIEPVTRQVTALADKIREFVNSESIERLKVVLVEGFEAGTQAIKDFLAQFGSVEQATDRVTTGLEAVSSGFGKLSAAARAAGNGIMAVFQAVNTVISGLATGISAAVTVIVGVVDGLIQSLNAIGLASDSLALKSRAAVETLQEMNVELAKRTVQAARDAAAAATEMVSAIGELGDAAEGAGAKVGELGDELGNAAEGMETAAEAVTRLKGEVEFLTADIDALIESGAGMDLISEKFHELGRAIDELEAAEAAAEMEQLANAATDAGNAASDAAQGMTDMAAVLRQGQGAAVDLAGELAKLRQQYDDGKISARDYAQAVAGLGRSLQGLAIDELSREMANLGKQFRDGKISAEELRIATELVNAELERQAQAARDARKENLGLADSNRELASSYRDVADAAGDASNALASREGRRLVDPAQLNDLESLVRLLNQANDTIRTTRIRGGDRGAVRLAADYRDAIQARIDELRAQTRVDRESRQSQESAPAPQRQTSSAPVNINIAGVLDVNDRATLDALARKLQPVLRDIQRRSP